MSRHDGWQWVSFRGGAEVPIVQSPEMVAVDPTVGAVIAGLKLVLDKLNTMAQTLSGELKSIVLAASAEAQHLVDYMNYAFEKQMDKTFKQLKELERQTYTHATELTAKLEMTTIAIANKAFEQARELAYDGDILSYNALYSLPCRDHKPRLVYASPRKVRVTGKQLSLRIRGNFLAHEAPPKVAVTIPGSDSVEAEVLSYTSGEVTIILPPDVSNVMQETLVKIAMQPPACEAHELFGGYSIVPTQSPQSIALTVLPRRDFTITGTLTPYAELPEERTFGWSFYEWADDCNADYRADRNWHVPPQYDILDHGVNVTTKNCGSDVGPHTHSQHMVRVEAWIRGCGTSWGFCKGHGWLGYDVTARTERYSEKALESDPFTDNTEGQTSYTYAHTYSKPLPPVYKNLRWTFDSVIVMTDGTTTKRIPLNEFNSPVTDPDAGIITGQVSPDGKLSIKIQGPPTVAGTRPWSTGSSPEADTDRFGMPLGE